MAKKKPLSQSTRWFVGNEDDAQQIAEWFHSEGQPGHAMFDENLEKIRNAVVGTPKKGIVGMLDWCLKQLAESPVEDPFVAGVAFDEWAQKRGYGKYADEDFADIEVEA